MTKTKVCKKCKRELSTNMFHKNKNELYGVHSICKQCKKECQQKNRKKLAQNDRERWEQYKKQLKQHPLDKNATKICNYCKKKLTIDMFYNDSTKKDGVHTICKICRVEKQKKYYQKNRGRVLQQNKKYQHVNKDKIEIRRKKYCKNNKERIAKRRKEYYLKNKDRISNREKEYRQKNKDEINRRQRIYYKENKEKFKEYGQRYRQKHGKEIRIRRKSYRPKIRANERKRYENDINYKLAGLMRNRIYSVLIGKAKSKPTMELLGCNIETLKEHLQKQFTDSMSFNNYGKWHVDHIQPCNTFDLTKPEEQKQCFNYKNLRPLWGIDNISRPKDGRDI